LYCNTGQLVHGMHAATSKVENSAKGLSCQLKFAHVLTCYSVLLGNDIEQNFKFLKTSYTFDIIKTATTTQATLKQIRQDLIKNTF